MKPYLLAVILAVALFNCYIGALAAYRIYQLDRGGLDRRIAQMEANQVKILELINTLSETQESTNRAMGSTSEALDSHTRSIIALTELSKRASNQ